MIAQSTITEILDVNYLIYDLWNPEVETLLDKGMTILNC